MWSLRRTARPRATRPSARLRLEALDLRLPPSSLLDLSEDDPTLTPPPGTDAPTQVAAPTDPGQTSAPGAVPLDATEPATGDSPPPEPAPPPPLLVPANAPPRVINFQGVEVVGGLWRFTGDVIDESPGGLTVRFGGEPVSLQGVTTTTDANGHFDKSVLVNRDGSDNGLASAQTTDGAGLDSNVAFYNISPS